MLVASKVQFVRQRPRIKAHRERDRRSTRHAAPRRIPVRRNSTKENRPAGSLICADFDFSHILRCHAMCNREYPSHTRWTSIHTMRTCVSSLLHDRVHKSKRDSSLLLHVHELPSVSDGRVKREISLGPIKRGEMYRCFNKDYLRNKIFRRVVDTTNKVSQTPM